MSLLKAPGGKYYLAPKIVKMMRPHAKYVEPCFFSGAVYWEKCKVTSLQARINIINDINPEITNFWECVRDNWMSLHKGLKAIPEYSGKAFRIWKESEGQHRIVKAMRTMVVSRMSRGGMGQHFSDSTRQRGGTYEGENAWNNAVKEIAYYSRLLQETNAQIFNGCLLPLLEMHGNDPGALWYIDPPYIGPKNLYKFGDFPHEEMLKIVVESDSRFIISGYDTPLYRNYLSGATWSLTKVDMPNRLAQTKELPGMTECIWRNFL